MFSMRVRIFKLVCYNLFFFSLKNKQNHVFKWTCVTYFCFISEERKENFNFVLAKVNNAYYLFRSLIYTLFFDQLNFTVKEHNTKYGICLSFTLLLSNMILVNIMHVTKTAIFRERKILYVLLIHHSVNKYLLSSTKKDNDYPWINNALNFNSYIFFT